MQSHLVYITYENFSLTYIYIQMLTPGKLIGLPGVFSPTAQLSTLLQI